MNGRGANRLTAAMLAALAGCGPQFPSKPAPVPEPAAAMIDAKPAQDTRPAPAAADSAALSHDAAAPVDAPTVDGRPVDASSELSARNEGGAPTDGQAPAASALFGFENAAPDWTSTETTLTRDTTVVSEGAAALAFTMTKNKAAIRSRAFDTTEFTVPGTSRLSIDLFLEVPQPSGANVGARFECASAKLNESGIPAREVAALPAGRWVPLVLAVPPHVAAVLTKNYWQGCKIWLEINNLDGLVRVDRMTFVP